MKILELEDRLYTSTEVAKILGVSLRSVYRYLEDSKLDAEMKTATGRHRFTKQNILDFLSPQQAKVPAPSTPVAVEVQEEIVVEKAEEPVAASDDEEVDWLAKFRTAAAKYKAESEEPKAAEKQTVSGLADVEAEAPSPSPTTEFYYTSAVGGLKDIAQNLDKSARKASLDYAFTMDSGLSLHKPIRPFSVIHAYVRSEDLPFFEKILNLSTVDKGEAQLCLVVSDLDSVYTESKEMHGLKVVSDAQLKKDLTAAGEEDLAEEL